MSRATYRRRILHRLMERPRTQFQLMESFRPDRREGFSEHLDELEARGDVTFDPTDHTYTISKEAAMRLTKRPQQTQTEESTVADLAAERDRLITEMWGPHALMVQAVEDDEVLHEMLACVLPDIPALDLTEIPRHRRAAAVESAVEDWTNQTRSGPCGFCGSRTIRRGNPFTRSAMDPNEIPGFTSIHGQKACGACVELIEGDTLSAAKERVFNAIGGCVGLPIVGNYRHTDDLIPWAFEVGYIGAPWGHLLTEDSKNRIRARVYQVVHRRRIRTATSALPDPSIPGIIAPVWDEDALPGGKRRVFAPVFDLINAAEEEQALEQRRAEAAAAKNRPSVHAKRDERREAERVASEKALAQRLKATGVDRQIQALKKSGVI